MSLTEKGTKVLISVYKPMGFEYTYWLPTEDRGAAASLALQYHTKNFGSEVVYLNNISCNLSRKPDDRFIELNQNGEKINESN